MKIFVENSALFYYERARYILKKQERQGAYEHEKIHNRF